MNLITLTLPVALALLVSGACGLESAMAQEADPSLAASTADSLTAEADTTFGQDEHDSATSGMSAMDRTGT